MQKTRILIVEDETIVSMDLEFQLKALGYEPVAAVTSGEQALVMTERLRPDLVLMDVHLNGELDGIAAAQMIHERFSIPVVFLTAFMEESVLSMAKAAQPYGYLSKPFQTIELRITVEMAVTRRQAEMQMQMAHDEQAAILQTAMDGFWIVNSQARLLEVNDAYCRMSGYSREELLRMTIADLDADKNLEQITANIDRIQRTGCDRFERRHRRKDGTVIDIELSVTFFTEAEGRCCCFLRDITKRKTAEQNYQMLFREMLNGFALHEIIRNTEGRVVDYRFLAVNPAFERMTGLNAERILGKTAMQVLPDIERHWIETYGKVALTGEPVFFENYAAELKKHFEVTAFRPALNQFACIFADITHRKQVEDFLRQSEEQLRQAQKMETIGQLAGGVAHDFNNILSAMMIHLNLLQTHKNVDRECRELVDELMMNAKRAASLTRQLLQFGRRSIMETTIFDLNELTAEFLTMLSRLIGENITVRFNPSITPPLLEADAGMIEQTLMNLCVNARDAMPEGGALTIGIDSIQIDTERIRGHMKIQPGKFVCLSVADTGCGMDEAMLGHIFEPFYTTKEFGKGTGLGLATVYGIVSQHKGWVEVESAIGKGSTFKLFFPATSKEKPSRANDRKPPASSGSATILYVEDETNLRRLVSKSLRQLGYGVLEAADGLEALKTWEEHASRIDLLFSDMLMPGGMTGLNLAARLRKEKPGLKVIISSGYTAETTTPPQPSGEEIVYFNKPFEFEDLTKTIQDCLASR